MKSLLYLSLLIVAACGVKHHSSTDYGKTTVADLISEKGEPVEEKVVPVEGNKMLIYKDNEKYQVKGNIVTHGFKDPRGEEKTVLYWKHRFKDCETTTKQINKVVKHELPEYELACPSEGISVLYTEGSDFVSRVIEYEKK